MTFSAENENDEAGKYIRSRSDSRVIGCGVGDSNEAGAKRCSVKSRNCSLDGNEVIIVHASQRSTQLERWQKSGSDRRNERQEAQGRSRGSECGVHDCTRLCFCSKERRRDE